MRKPKELTDTEKLQRIKLNSKEDELIEKVMDLLEELRDSLNEKDIECEIDGKIDSLVEELEHKVERNFFESKRLYKELMPWANKKSKG
jgi:hypothetical protein